MKIKVIDLLNRIANGEVPAKIKFDDEVYVYNNGSISIDTLYRTYGPDGIDWLVQKDIPLNAEVEIIVEEPEIDIQGIEYLDGMVLYNADESTFKAIADMNNKIGELIRAIKQLDKQIKEK